MTPFPNWVSSEASIDDALVMMKEHAIRHLPVKHNGELFGVITERDIKQAQNIVEKAVSQNLKVKDICIQHLYVVEMETPIDEVLMNMVERHIGSALVIKQGRLAGLFTTSDACRCYAEHLRYTLRVSGGNDVA